MGRSVCTSTIQAAYCFGGYLYICQGLQRWKLCNSLLMHSFIFNTSKSTKSLSVSVQLNTELPTQVMNYIFETTSSNMHLVATLSFLPSLSLLEITVEHHPQGQEESPEEWANTLWVYTSYIAKGNWQPPGTNQIILLLSLPCMHENQLGYVYCELNH